MACLSRQSYLMKSCSVGNHVFLLMWGMVEIDFFLELLSMTIAYIVKPENPWLQGRQARPQGKCSITRLLCCYSMSPVPGFSMSCCTLEWEEYKTVDRHSSQGLTCVTFPGAKLHTTEEKLLCILRYTQPTPITSMTVEVLSTEDRLICLVKNIYSIKPLTQNTIVLMGPRKNTREMSGTTLSLLFSIKKKNWKKKCFYNGTATALVFVKVF